MATLVAYLLTGLALMIGHHSYFASIHMTSANGRATFAGYQVSKQQITNVISTTFIFLVKLFMSLTISTSFDQQLWLTLRSRSTKLRNINSLFEFLDNPSTFLNFSLLRKARAVTVIAISFWTTALWIVPIPSSLRVQSVTLSDVQELSVPTVNMSTPGLMRVEPISFGDIPIASAPSSILDFTSSRVLISGNPQLWKSPCGSDCLYTVTFPGPALKCSEPVEQPHEEVVIVWEVPPFQRSATKDTLIVGYVTNPDDTVRTWSKTTCESFMANYTVEVSYAAGIQTTRLQNMAFGESFGTSGSTAADQFTMPPIFGMAVVKDIVWAKLTGNVSLTPVDFQVEGTTVSPYSPLVNFTNPVSSARFPVFRNDTPKLIEEMMVNTTISLMKLQEYFTSSGTDGWNTTLPVNVNNTFVAYIYVSTYLWAGYGLCLFVTVVSMVFGLHAVKLNGGGGGRSFSLVVAMTRNEELDKLPAVHKDWKQAQEAKLKFTPVQDERDGSRRLVLGVDEKRGA